MLLIYVKDIFIKKVSKGFFLQYLHTEENRNLYNAIVVYRCRALMFLEGTYEKILYRSSKNDLEITPSDEVICSWKPIEEHASKSRLAKLMGLGTLSLTQFSVLTFCCLLHRTDYNPFPFIIFIKVTGHHAYLS